MMNKHTYVIFTTSSPAKLCGNPKISLLSSRTFLLGLSPFTFLALGCFLRLRLQAILQSFGSSLTLSRVAIIIKTGLGDTGTIWSSFTETKNFDWWSHKPGMVGMPHFETWPQLWWTIPICHWWWQHSFGPVWYLWTCPPPRLGDSCKLSPFSPRIGGAAATPLRCMPSFQERSKACDLLQPSLNIHPFLLPPSWERSCQRFVKDLGIKSRTSKKLTFVTSCNFVILVFWITSSHIEDGTLG